MNAELLNELKNEKDMASPITAESMKECNVRGPIAKWDLKGNVNIGSYTSINGLLRARGEVYVGKYCAFGANVSLLGGNHKTNMVNQQVWLQQRLGFKICHESKGPICIGHNVWIGDKATVLTGVSIGHGAVIGAGAVVTKDVEPFTIVIGNPAKAVKQRFTPNVIEQLLQIAWWNWSFERMQRNREFFELEITSEENVDLTEYLID